jgi:peptide deformylase
MPCRAAAGCRPAGSVAGQCTWIEYDYTVSEEKWGPWYQRTVRSPTKRLSVRLVFPTEVDPAVWGIETTMTAEALPFRTAINQDRTDDHITFSWATDDPPLHARYRLEWKFRAHDEEPMRTTPSDTMRSIGIVQEGDLILNQPARPFNLPREAEDARRVVTQLHSAMQRVMAAHTFTKGTGIAAPQIGIDRAAAIVRTPDGETFTLLNPRIIEESLDGDEKYEGCLSFFDVRGLVPRALTLEVEHQDIDGQRRITVFQRAVARLVAHEIDHLNGILYTERMRPEVKPIPVTEYEGTGRQHWTY